MLSRDDAGRVLLVRATHRSGWDLPGGFVEKGESPRATATRNVRDDLGADLEVADLLVVDWSSDQPEGDQLVFIFGGRMIQDGIHSYLSSRDRAAGAEMRFVPSEQLQGLMPSDLVERVVEAAGRYAAIYRESGNPLAGADATAAAVRPV